MPASTPRERPRPGSKIRDRARSAVEKSTTRAGAALVKVPPALRWLIKLRGSPEAVARGVAIGLFIAFTPTIGFQVLLAAIAATVLSANRPAAIAGVFVTNPLTIPPIYGFTYWLGSRFWPGPSVASVRRLFEETGGKLANHDFWNLQAQLKEFAAIGVDVFVATSIGGVIVGAVAAGLSYAVVPRVVRSYRDRLKPRMRDKMAERRARRKTARRGHR